MAIVFIGPEASAQSGALFAPSEPVPPETINWEALPGPYGGPAISLASTQAPDDETVAVASDQYYLYRSTDGGEQWQRIRQGSARLVADSSGTFWAIRDHLLRSTDYGLTWTPHADGLPATDVTDLASGSDGSLYAATDEGVYRLDRAVGVWQSTGMKERTRSLAAGADSVILAGTEPAANTADPFSIQRSTDGGQTWSRVTVKPESHASVLALAILPDGTALASGSAMYARPGLFRSTDAGATWEPVPEFGEAVFDAFHVDTKGAVYAATRSLGSVRSLDGGRTWQKMAISVAGVAQGPGEDILFATGRHGIVRSGDSGATFDDATHGFGRAELGHVAIGDGGTVYVGSPRRFGDHGDLYRSQDEGQTWQHIAVDFIPHGLNDLYHTSGGALLAAPDGCGCVEKGGRLFRSEDDGASWVDVAPDTVGDDGEVFRAYFLREHTDRTLWMVADTEGKRLIYRSTTDGKTWEQRTPAPINVGAFSIGPTGDLWVAAEQVPQDGVPVYRSTDKAGSWEHVTTFSAVRASAILVTPTEHVVVSTLDPDFYSPDGGQTWSEVDLAVGEVWHEVDVFLQNESGILFGGVDAYPPIIQSEDDGETWQPAVSGLPQLGSHSYTDLALDDSGYLWAALGGYGLFRTTRSTNVSVDREARPPSPRLSVYPNPARESASVILGLSRAEPRMELELFDITGRRIMKAALGPLSPGDYRRRISVGGLPAGVYLLRASGISTTLTSRLVIVR